MVLYQMVARILSATSSGGEKKVDLKSQNRHQAREKLNVGEAEASAHWCPPVHQAALQLRAGATTAANKLLLPLSSLKLCFSESQQERNLNGVQTHHFREAFLQLPPGKPWSKPSPQPSVQLAGLWVLKQNWTNQHSQMKKTIGLGARSNRIVSHLWPSDQ